MTKRLTRAKTKDKKTPAHPVSRCRLPHLLPERHRRQCYAVVYLIYNEGYGGTHRAGYTRRSGWAAHWPN